MSATQVGAELHQQRYRIRQQLGKGGFGAVYLADDLRLPGRQVALKENLGVNAESKGQFKREALLLARLRHPNLPQVTDYFFDTDGRQFLVMDYIPGENLRQVMAQHNGALPVDEALAAVEQVMQALAYMHAWRDPESGEIKPVIHRDIKPDNIKRTPDGRFVLVDFGIAKVDTDTATALSARALTPGYAPIEQYHGGTDERSDIYALAATLYALLTGKAPPSATSLAAGLSLPPPRSLNADIPMRCVKVIDKAMQLKPEDRYQSIGDMYRALFDRTMPMTGSVPPPTRSRQEPVASSARPQRSSVMAGVLVLGALLAILGIGLALLSAPTVESGVAGSSAAAGPASTQIASNRPVRTPQVMRPASVVEGGHSPESPAIAVVASAAATQQTNESTSIILPLPTATTTETPANEQTTLEPDVAPTSTPVSGSPISEITETAGNILDMPRGTPSETVTGMRGAESASLPSPDMTLTAVVQTQTPQAALAVTSTPMPTSTALPPMPTATWTATRTPFPTSNTVSGANPSASDISGIKTSDGGPTSAQILRPADNNSSNVATEFTWQPNAKLRPGQEYEVVFWRARGESETDARGLVRSSVDTSIYLPINLLPPETYQWALWLVQPEPYSRIRRLAGPFEFTVPSSDSGRGSGSGSVDTGTGSK